MKKKLDKEINKIAKNEPELKFKDGVYFMRHLYDSALVKILGRPLGILVSDYLIKRGLEK